MKDGKDMKEGGGIAWGSESTRGVERCNLEVVEAREFGRIL